MLKAIHNAQRNSWTQQECRKQHESLFSKATFRAHTELCMSCTLSTQPTRRKGQSVQNRIGRVKTNHFERKDAIFLCEVKRCPKMRSLTKLFQSPMAKNNCQAAMCSNSTRHFEVNLRKLSDFLCHTECPRVHKGRCGH